MGTDVDSPQDADEGKVFSRLYAAAIFALVISALTWAVVVVLDSERIIESWVPIARWVWLASTVLGIAASIAMILRGIRHRRRRSSPKPAEAENGLGRKVVTTILAWPFVASPLGAAGIGVIYLSLAHPEGPLAPLPLILGVVALLLSVPAMLLAVRPDRSQQGVGGR